MEIAVIGCGWLGLPLALRLKERGHTVFGSSTHQGKIEQLENQGITSFLYSGDEHSLLPNEIQTVALAILNFPPSPTKDYAEQMRQLIAQFSPATKLIFTSSTGVYQDIDGICNESSPVNVEHPVYLAEEVVRQSGRKTTILRLAGLVSEDRNPVKYLSGKWNADGQKIVNLVHRGDVMAVIETLLESDMWNETFNVCFPAHPSRNDYYTDQAKKWDLEIPTFSFSIGKGKEIDSSKLITLLNFSFQHPI